MDPLEAFEDELRKQAAYKDELSVPHYRYEPLDLVALGNDELEETSWLVDGLWPMGAAIHIHAQRKAGKSLAMLWIACKLALGHDPLTDEPQEPRRVGYWDFEMTRADLKRRVDDMGFDWVALSKMLNYYQLKPLPPLDTEEGGQHIVEQAIALDEQVVIIDTMSRVISGDENSADTYIKFSRFTGTPLKAAGKSVGRLDHEGHEAGRSRGSSAKSDDADITWQLITKDDGIEYVRKHSRPDDVPEVIKVRITTDPYLSYARIEGTMYLAGTKEKVAEMDELGIPSAAGRDVVKRILRENGKAIGATDVLREAIKFRQRRLIFP